ncbi:MAG TPA: peptidylprolyl isomerase [Myxococcaceae bacterium]|jgi:peptidyl-prolyl cis-trans isomerase SurA
MKRSPAIVSALLLGALSAPARAELVDRVAAVVNNDVITLSEVEQRAIPFLARADVKDPKERAAVRQKILKQSLDMLVGEKLMEQQLHDRNMDVSEQEIDSTVDAVKQEQHLSSAQLEQALHEQGFTVQSYRDMLKKTLARRKLVAQQVRPKVKISDEDIKAEYARWARSESSDPEVHARHILVQVGANAPAADVEKARLKAVALAEEARKPGTDFADLAKKKSEGPSASDGGDLGYFRRGVMVPEFDKIAFNLKVGEVGDPIRTKFGWHVIKVEERRAVGLKTFDEMKDELRDKMLMGQLEKYTEDYVQELRQGAAVEIKL